MYVSSALFYVLKHSHIWQCLPLTETTSWLLHLVWPPTLDNGHVFLQSMGFLPMGISRLILSLRLLILILQSMDHFEDVSLTMALVSNVVIASLLRVENTRRWVLPILDLILRNEPLNVLKILTIPTIVTLQERILILSSTLIMLDTRKWIMKSMDSWWIRETFTTMETRWTCALKNMFTSPRTSANPFLQWQDVTWNWLQS